MLSDVGTCLEYDKVSGGVEQHKAGACRRANAHVIHVRGEVLLFHGSCDELSNLTTCTCVVMLHLNTALQDLNPTTIIVAGLLYGH